MHFSEEAFGLMFFWLFFGMLQIFFSQNSLYADSVKYEYFTLMQVLNLQKSGESQLSGGVLHHCLLRHCLRIRCLLRHCLRIRWKRLASRMAVIDFLKKSLHSLAVDQDLLVRYFSI